MRRKPLKRPSRVAAILCAALAAVAVLLAGPRAHAGEEPAPPAPGACICVAPRGACQHFLHNPKKPTIDPCWCPACGEGPKQHDGRTVPQGWNATCLNDASEENYLKRHAAAWQIHCSECQEREATCKAAGGACTACAWSGPSTKDFAGRFARKTLTERLGKERRLFKDGDGVRLLYGKNFYLVTDVPQMKVAVTPTTARVVSGHEWAHLMMERAEYARREFERHLGGPVIIDKPTGMYVPVGKRDGNQLAGHYLGNETANVLYGGTDTSTVADAFCFHGFVISLDQFGVGGDDAIHFAMRHMIGHELISCWVVVDGHNRALPRWLSEGAAHWLSRLQPRFREDGFACSLEGAQLLLTGEKWEKECRRIAAETKPGAVETLLAKSAQGQLTADDHRRAWSWMHLCLSEWREPWVGMLRGLRKRVPARDAFVQNLGMTPEVFDERWRERVAGKRRSMDSKAGDDPAASAEKLGARERAALATEKDPATVAALVRGLGTIAEADTATAVVDLLAREHALVRETSFVALLGIQAPAVRDAAWKHGLAHKDSIARAYAARLCAERAVAAAVPALREQLAHANWYARAEAARALGTLADAESATRILKLVDDPADKTRVAAMDALALLGAKAEAAVPAIVRHLTAPRWQHRVAAAQALGRIGSMEAVEPLLARMEVESGRLRRDLQEALRRITHDDLGENPQHWRAWWEKQKAANGGRIPGRPADAPPKPPAARDPGSTSAEPDYFGIEIFANRVAFVLDLSDSMKLRFRPSPDARRGGRELRGGTKVEICKAEICDSLATLDPRSQFNVVVFGDRVQAWKDAPIVASPGNVADAIQWVKNQPCYGETNYYDALRTVLDLGDRPDAAPDFRDTPDTITFLTDGMPTKGDIVDAKTLLSWYTNLNRYARITTHVVAFGEKGLESEVLRALAERNYGVFVHVKGQDG